MHPRFVDLALVNVQVLIEKTVFGKHNTNRCHYENKQNTQNNWQRNLTQWLQAHALRLCYTSRLLSILYSVGAHTLL